MAHLNSIRPYSRFYRLAVCDMSPSMPSSVGSSPNSSIFSPKYKEPKNWSRTPPLHTLRFQASDAGKYALAFKTLHVEDSKNV